MAESLEYMILLAIWERFKEKRIVIPRVWGELTNPHGGIWELLRSHVENRHLVVNDVLKYYPEVDDVKKPRRIRAEIDTILETFATLLKYATKSQKKLNQLLTQKGKVSVFDLNVFDLLNHQYAFIAEGSQIHKLIDRTDGLENLQDPQAGMDLHSNIVLSSSGQLKFWGLRAEILLILVGFLSVEIFRMTLLSFKNSFQVIQIVDFVRFKKQKKRRQKKILKH